MSIIRSERPNSNFYILDKKISEDSSLTWQSRGLLIFLLGKPDNWSISVNNLRNETKTTRLPSGRDSIYSMLSELESIGYISRNRKRNLDGTLGEIDYLVKDFPVISDAQPDTAQPDTAQPDTAQPDTAQPDTANPTLISTDYSKNLKAVSIEKNKRARDASDFFCRITPENEKETKNFDEEPCLNEFKGTCATLSDKSNTNTSIESKNLLESLKIDSEIKESYPQTGKQKKEEFALPNWVPVGAWDDFIEMRVKKNKKPTKRALELLLKTLESLRNEGQNPEIVLNTSIENGWSGLFPTKYHSKSNSIVKTSSHFGIENTDFRKGVRSDGGF